jgi:tetratricopeptide (TPR) repeat protein
VSLWAYPVRTLWPVGLSPIYEAPPRLGLLEPSVLGALGGVALVTALAWLGRRRCPGLGAAWLSYAILLAPVAGVFSLGHHLTADRYSYLPCVGFAVLAGGAAAAAVGAAARGGRRGGGALVVAPVAVLVLALGVATWRQAHIWRDTASLWRHAVEATPDCAVCQVNHGDTLLGAGQPEAAVVHYRRAVLLRPDGIGPYARLGQALEVLGRRAEAIEWYRVGLTQRPEALSLRVVLAEALVRDGRLGEAVAALDGASRVHEPGALVRFFEAAARRRPEAPVPRAGLVRGWLALGERERARGELDVLRRLHPALAAAVAARLGGS